MVDPVENDEALRERLTELFEDSPWNHEPLTDEQKTTLDRAMVLRPSHQTIRFNLQALP